MKTVLVSGSFDPLHAGHIQFFRDARSLGDRLVVCVSGDEVIRQHKHRPPMMPDSHRAAVVEACRWVDEVHITRPFGIGLDFTDAWLSLRPDILAVTEDDQYSDVKQELVTNTRGQYIVLPKNSILEPITSEEIRMRASCWSQGK